ncbi:phage head closure protein [Clostridium thermobutyricum]|uniref:phage head closure protein n=1 Tax=Clostridium thermobutyricum TaxID=29372 RepID=UPI0018AAD151|nr:phage head closure protein [Clostridium thermobutyricum]
MILNEKQLTNNLRKTYNLKVDILILNDSSQDNEGFTIEKWDKYLTCWCFKKNSIGKEFINSNADNTEEIISLTTRYCNKIVEIDKPGMTKKLKLFYQGREWNIIDLDDYKDLHSEYDITAKLIN